MLIITFFLVAEDILAQLTDQLTRRKAQLQDAGQKLAQIQQAIDDQVHALLFEMDQLFFFFINVDHMI